MLPVELPVPGSGAILDAQPVKRDSDRLKTMLSARGSRVDHAAATASNAPSFLPADKRKACQFLRIS